MCFLRYLLSYEEWSKFLINVLQHVGSKMWFMFRGTTVSSTLYWRRVRKSKTKITTTQTVIVACHLFFNGCPLKESITVFCVVFISIFLYIIPYCLRRVSISVELFYSQMKKNVCIVFFSPITRNSNGDIWYIFMEKINA